MSRGAAWRKSAGWGGFAAALAVAAWWACTVPYRPGRIYDAVPGGAVLVTRHLEVGERWGDVVRNPLAQSLLGTAGISMADVLAAADDEETLSWVRKLTGRETLLAYVPEGAGRREAWLGAAWLGGGAQRLRWQLELFRPAGYRWLGRCFGCSVWEVEDADVGYGKHLVLAFAEGMLLAAISADPMAIESMVVALERQEMRLREQDGAFARFAGRDQRDVPDVAWIREAAAEGTAVGWGVGGETLEISSLSQDRLAGRAEFGGGWTGTEAFPASADRPPRGWEGLERTLGSAPCAVVTASRATLDWLWRTPGLDPVARHSILQALIAVGDRIVLACLDGELSGRLSFGMMKTFGLRGIRVPTLVAATPVPQGEEDALAKLQRVLDSCNARYRGAFTMRPVVQTAGVKMWTLESAGGDEWVDALSIDDRPACAVVDGWLLVASNLDTLRALARGKGRETTATAARLAGDPGLRPAWALAAESETAPCWAWMDIQRAGDATLDVLSMMSMVLRFTPDVEADQREANRRAIDSTKTWVRALKPFAEARASLERCEDGMALAADLGAPR